LTAARIKSEPVAEKPLSNVPMSDNSQLIISWSSTLDIPGSCLAFVDYPPGK